jgi:hypothetical protein
MLEELKTQIDTATDRELVDALNALRVRHGRRVNAPLRGLVTEILEDNEGNATNEEADGNNASKDSSSEDSSSEDSSSEDSSSEDSSSEDKKPKDKTVLSSFGREKRNTRSMIRAQAHNLAHGVVI